ncbi:MAG: hypothetical protein IKM30_05865 [Oscillospiraceae bacterium]|nr:hypothetical protein [Oscillospiraceae bacterium]
MNELRKIWRCAASEYLQWLTDSRMILLTTLLLFDYLLAVEPLITRAKEMQEPISWLEPFLAVAGSGTVLLILPITFFILISDYPRNHGNAIFYICRIGRQRWMLAQLLALFLMILTYLLIVAFGAILPALPYCRFDFQWSKVVTDYAIHFPEQAASYELLPENLYYQLKDTAVGLFYTYTLLVCYLFLLGTLQICGTVLGHRKVANIMAGFLIAGGAAIATIHSRWMWLFPMAHSITWLHFTKYLRKPVMPMWGSYLYLAGGSIILCIIALTKVRLFSFDMQED